jgi:hypothetical protein
MQARSKNKRNKCLKRENFFLFSNTKTMSEKESTAKVLDILYLFFSLYQILIKRPSRNREIF